jgi:hypothetical protein
LEPSVEEESIYLVCAGASADAVAGLHDHGRKGCAGEFIGAGKAGESGSNDDNISHGSFTSASSSTLAGTELVRSKDIAPRRAQSPLKTARMSVFYGREQNKSCF